MGYRATGLVGLWLALFFATAAAAEPADDRPYVPASNFVVQPDNSVVFSREPSKAIVDLVAASPVKKMSYQKGRFMCGDYAFAFRNFCAADGISCRQVAVWGEAEGKRAGHGANIVIEKADQENRLWATWIEPQTNKIVASWQFTVYGKNMPESAMAKIKKYYREDFRLDKLTLGELTDSAHLCGNLWNSGTTFQKFPEVVQEFHEKTGIDPRTWKLRPLAPALPAK